MPLRTIGDKYTVIKLTFFAIGLLSFQIASLLVNCLALISFANIISPSLIMLLCPAIGYVLVKKEPYYIWSPVPWFLLACGLFFGLGPLVLVFGNIDSITYANAYFVIDDSMFLRTNILNTIGISLTLLFVYIFHNNTIPQKNNWLLPKKSYPVKEVLMAFLLIGLPLQYIFSWPYKIGILGWTLPGIIITFADLGAQSIILLYILSMQNRRYDMFFWALLVVEFTSAAMTFSKLEVIMIILYLIIPAYSCKKKVDRLIGWIIGVFALYVFILNPFVSAARIYSSLTGVSNLGKFFDTLINYRHVGIEELYGDMVNVQGWWTRLNYANAQAFAMSEYDHGRNGNSLMLAFYTFVPRFIFPEKPTIPMGRYFNGIATGNFYSNSAPGFFGEAYWNGGWVCLFFISILYAFLLSFLSVLSMCNIKNGNYLFVPVAIIGIKMGLHMDGWIVPITLGGFLHAIFLYLFLGQILLPAMTKITRIMKNNKIIK